MSFAVSDTTQKVLKNFSGISDQIILNPGTVQRTLLSTKSVFAVAKLPEPWPRLTPLYKLREFCAVLSQFDKPVIDFSDSGMIVRQDVGTRLRITERYSDPTTVQAAPDRTLPTEDPAIEFILSNYTLSTIKKTAALLRLTHFTVTVKNGEVVLSANDPKLPNSNEFDITILAADTTVHDASFTRVMRFNVEHIGYLMDGDYNMAIREWKYAYLEHKSLPVSYFVAEDTQVE